VPLEEGWNLIAYFPTYELDASAPDFYVLSPIIGHVILAKDGDGHFMSPAFDYSNMSPWREGQGYHVKVDADVVLNYPDEQIMMADRNVTARNDCPAGLVHSKTGRNMSLLSLESDGDEIAAFTEDGLCVGCVVLKGEAPWGMAIWGDDPATEEKDGLAEGEAFTLKLSDNTPLKVSKVLSGSGLVYSTDGFTVVKLESEFQLPSEYYLADAFPNPFNNLTKLSYGLPEPGRININIFDISGRLVTTLIDCQQIAGRYSVSWDASGMPSGVYMCRLSADNCLKTRKLVLLR